MENDYLMIYLIILMVLSIFYTIIILGLGKLLSYYKREKDQLENDIRWLLRTLKYPLTSTRNFNEEDRLKDIKNKVDFYE